MAKKKRGQDRDGRMDTLADLTPENLKRSSGKGRKGRGPAPASAAEQEAWDQRVAEAKEKRAGRSTTAPLIVAGIAAVAVVGVIVWSTVSSNAPVTVDTIPERVIAADGAGSAVYPANSAEAVREDIRFGFAPAVDLVELGDGTVVLGAGGPDDGADVFGKPYAKLTAETFAEASIPAPRDDTNDGTPVTWAEVFDDYGDDTLFMPAVDAQPELDAVLETASDADRLDAVIVRTADEELAAAADSAGAAVLFDGDVDGLDPSQLDDLYWGVAVPVDSEDLDAWTDSDLAVWITGDVQKNQVGELSRAGIQGFLVADPFSVQVDSDE